MKKSILLIGALPLLAACSSNTTTTTAPTAGTTAALTVSCRQKSTADGHLDCANVPGKTRKLDCDTVAQIEEALGAGCTPTKPGDNDVCCPTTVSGVAPSGTTTTVVACQQKPGADTDKDCAGQPSRPRKLDCDADKTEEALAAGCTRTKPGDSDVCCPKTVSGGS